MCEDTPKQNVPFQVKAELASSQVENQEEAAQLKDEFETLKLRYEFLKGVYEAENQRRRTVEQKASLLIGSLSMMGAVIVGVANFYSGDTPSQVAFYIVFYTASLAISLCFTLYHAIRTLKKRTLTLMDTNDQENIIGSKAFFMKMIENLSTCIEKNKIITNYKVDEMEMSQNWFYIVLLSIGFYFTTLIMQVILAKMHWNSFALTSILIIIFVQICISILRPIYKKN